MQRVRTASHQFEDSILQKIMPASTSEKLLQMQFQQKSSKSSQQIQEIQKNKNCLIHQEKKAKYSAIIDNIQNYYCIKCAINLAKEGHQLVELQNSKTKKIVEIQNLIERLDSAQEKMAMVKQQLNKKKNQNYQSEKKYLNDFKERMTDFIQNLQTQQEQICIALQKQMIQDDEIYNKQLKYLSYHDKDLVNMQYKQKNIKEDIQNNQNSIINNIEMEPYIEIMGNYESQIQNIDQFLINLNQKQIKFQKIDLDDFNKQIKNFKLGTTNESFSDNDQQQDLTNYKDLLNYIQNNQNQINQRYKIDQSIIQSVRNESMYQSKQIYNSNDTIQEKTNINDNKVLSFQRQLFGSPKFKNY